MLFRSDFTVVATDTGFAKKARNFAEALDAPLAIVEKRRTNNAGGLESLGLIGSVEGRNAVIVDDEIGTGSSIVQAARVVRESGGRDIYAAAVHGILSGPAIETIEHSDIKQLVITDTVPLPPEKRIPRIAQCSVAELFAGAIARIHEDRSVSELFR